MHSSGQGPKIAHGKAVRVGFTGCGVLTSKSLQKSLSGMVSDFKRGLIESIVGEICKRPNLLKFVDVP